MAPSRTTTDVEQTKPDLSSNDSAVLQALFDAESAPSPASSVVQADASLPPLPQISPSDLPDLQEREVQAIRPLQQQQSPDETDTNTTTTRPPRGAVETAIADLGAIIAEQPEYASAYVNRAQALRMLVEADLDPDSGGNEEDILSSASSHCAQVLDDLSRAIGLLTPDDPTAPVSPLQARILSNAHTHRAYLLYRASRSSSQTETQTETQPSSSSNDDAVPHDLAILPSHLRRLGPERLEEMASWDFQQGGRYGNPVAKQLAVHTNPYAKMCGAIVRDAMRAEIEEWMGRSQGGQGGQVV